MNNTQHQFLNPMREAKAWIGEMSGVESEPRKVRSQSADQKGNFWMAMISEHEEYLHFPAQGCMWPDERIARQCGEEWIKAYRKGGPKAADKATNDFISKSSKWLTTRTPNDLDIGDE